MAFLSLYTIDLRLCIIFSIFVLVKRYRQGIGFHIDTFLLRINQNEKKTITKENSPLDLVHMVLDYLYQSDSWRMFLQPQPIIIAPSAVLDLDAWNSIVQAVETIS